MLRFYKDIIKKRKTIPALTNCDRNSIETETFTEEGIITIERRKNNSRVLAVMSFNSNKISTNFCFPSGVWKKILDSSEKKWNGPGQTMPDIPDDILTEITIPGYNISLYESETG